MSSVQTYRDGRLMGRHILITGAASGIGLATARLFAEEGASLALIDRSAEALAVVAEQLGAVFGAVELTDEADVKAVVADVVGRLGALDGLVNVAGIGSFQRLEEIDLAEWNRVIAVNLTAPMLVARECIAHLRAAPGGATIVNVSSGQGLHPSTGGMAAYCASKGGLVMFDKQQALELAPVRVNSICPGVVDTPLLPPGMAEATAQEGSPYALRRMASPKEIADAALFLTSRESSFVTGVALAVDGGRTYH